MNGRFKIGCDVGETQESLNPLIMARCDIVHVACGAHAGSPEMMHEAVQMASTYQTKVSLHPGYEDKANFGRKELNLDMKSLKLLILYQWGALSAIASLTQSSVLYIKPHGALYHRIYSDIQLWIQILSWMPSMTWIVPMNMSQSVKEKVQKMYHIRLISEVYADRHYDNQGQLVDRSYQDSALLSEEEIHLRVWQLENEGTVTSVEGEKIHVDSELLSFHSDYLPSLNYLKNMS